MPAEVETFGIMLDETAAANKAVAGIAQAYKESSLAREFRPQMETLLARLDAAAKSGGSPDALLAQSLSTQGKVILPMVFQIGRPIGTSGEVSPAQAQRVTSIEASVGP